MIRKSFKILATMLLCVTFTFAQTTDSDVVKSIERQFSETN